MFDVKTIATEIVAREGGYVNDPDDPGGPTKYGVTIHTMRRLRLDLDKDGDVDAADVRRLTIGQATDIFLKHYYEKPRISELPRVLRDTVFDMQVNAGSNAVKILQRMLNRIGYNVGKADGAIGPKTLEGARQAAERLGPAIRDAYGIERRNYYYRLADIRPASRKYARRRDGGKGGWIKRAEEFMKPKFRLTDAEHRARTKGW